MTFEDQEALDLWQAFARTDGPRVADALLEDYFAPAEYREELELVRKEMADV